MNAFRRIAVLASAALLGAGSAALAQEAEQPQDEPAPAPIETIGPPQIQDFSLNGTVTQEAREPAEQAPRQRPPAESTQPAQRPAPRPVQEPADEAPAERAIERDTPVDDSGAIADPAPEPAFPADTQLSEPAPVRPAADSGPGEPQTGGVTVLPWLLAGLALAGGLAFYFLRLRRRESYAGAHSLHDFGLAREPEPQPEPRPEPQPVRKPPAPAPAADVGVVSTRIRPWLELEFKPQRGVLDENRAAIAFELSVVNSGSMPARDVLLEASLFNAGPMQDQQIKLFFDNPVAKGDRIPLIPPLQKVTLNTAVFLPREQVRTIELEGVTMFVPMIAVNALYAWGSAGKGQTSASYLVGKTTTGEKLAPFRVDMGPRVFRNLAAREHELRLRD